MKTLQQHNMNTINIWLQKKLRLYISTSSSCVLSFLHLSPCTCIRPTVCYRLLLLLFHCNLYQQCNEQDIILKWKLAVTELSVGMGTDKIHLIFLVLIDCLWVLTGSALRVTTISKQHIKDFTFMWMSRMLCGAGACKELELRWQHHAVVSVLQAVCN